MKIALLRQISALFVFIVSTLFFAGCSETHYDNIELGCFRIPTGHGPETIVADTTPIPRLFVSSHNRRQWNSFGEIYAIDLRTPVSIKMKRKHEPGHLPFRPEGIALGQNNRGEKLLYVALHGEQQPGTDHGIAIYKVTGNLLLFREYLKDPLLRQPVNIVALPGGKLFVTNNSAVGHSFLGFFRKKTGQVLFYDGKKWSVSADELDFANGIAYIDGRLAVAETKGSRLALFDANPETGELTNRRQVGGEIPNPDNISFGPGNIITGAAHPSTLDFIQHSRFSDHPAPSLIYQTGIEPEDQAKTIYLNDGYEISATTGGVYFQDMIYMSQLMGNYVLACEPPGTQP